MSMKKNLINWILILGICFSMAFPWNVSANAASTQINYQPELNNMGPETIDEEILLVEEPEKSGNVQLEDEEVSKEESEKSSDDQLVDKELSEEETKKPDDIQQTEEEKLKDDIQQETEEILRETEKAEDNLQTEEELSKKEETEEAIDDQQTSEGISKETLDLEPRSRAEVISKYNILKIAGNGRDNTKITQSFSQSSQNRIDHTSYKANQPYQPKNLTIDIRRRGSIGNIKIISPDCEVLDDGAPYDCIYDSYGGLVEWSASYLIRNINPDVSQIKIQFAVNTTNSSGSARRILRDIEIPLVDSRLQAPTSPQIIYNPAYPDSYVLTGTDASMEYAVTVSPFMREAFTWQPCTGEDMVLNPGGVDIFYLVRYKGTTDQEESQYLTLTLPRRSSAPSVSFNKTTELLTGVTTEMEYSLGGESYAPVTDGMVSGGISNIIDEISGTEPVDLRVRQRLNDQPASIDQIIKIFPRLEEPVGIALNPFTYVLTGVRSGMEYRVEPANQWISINTSQIALEGYSSAESDVTVQVRYKCTTKNSNSKSVSITLPRLTVSSPALTLDFAGEVIRGFDSSKKYQVSTKPAGPWSAVSLTNDLFFISNRITTAYDTVLYIREAATADKPFSAITEISLPKRKKAPTNITFVYNDASLNDHQALLINVNKEIEYRIGNNGAFTPCGGETIVFELPASSVVYYFREKATDTNFASAYQSARLKNSGNAPNVSLNSSTELISTFTNGMEYQVNGGEFRPAEEMKTLSMSEIADSLKKGETYRVSVRVMRTATVPASKISTMVVYPRPAAPQNLTYNAATYMLSGVSSKMQYRQVGNTSWNKIEASQISLYALANGRPDVQIEVRYKNTNGVFASYPTIVNLY